MHRILRIIIQNIAIYNLIDIIYSCQNRVWVTICENYVFIYKYSKQKVLSFGNDLATESNANVLSEIWY